MPPSKVAGSTLTLNAPARPRSGARRDLDHLLGTSEKKETLMSLPKFLGYLCWATILAVCVLLLSPAVFHAAPQNSGYRVLRTIPLGGQGGSDYVTGDPDAKRIYIPRSTRIMMLDEDSGKLVGDIQGMNELHGLAFATKFNLAFVPRNTS